MSTAICLSGRQYECGMPLKNVHTVEDDGDSSGWVPRAPYQNRSITDDSKKQTSNTGKVKRKSSPRA